MDKKLRKEYEKILSNLWKYQEKLFEIGHTFWYCDAQDEEHKKPFYYYQINKSQNMATCSTCYDLMRNRKEIRRIQKILGIEQTPFYTNFKQEKHLKRMSVSNSSEWNPNYSYL